MATVTITLTDSPDGNVDVKLSFNPPLEAKESDPTPAQFLAVEALQKIRIYDVGETND